MRRPNPLRWLWYTFGGRLGEEYREWVLHDTTSRHWLLRHVVRIVVQALPIMIAAFVPLTLLPVPLWTIVGVLCVGLLGSLYFALGMAPEITEVRLSKHGYPPGTGRSVRALRRRHRHRHA